MQYSVKKSFLGKKIVDKYNNRFKLRESPYKIKFDSDSTFKLYLNGTAVTTSIKEFDFGSYSKVIRAKTNDGNYLFVDTELCHLSPEFIYKNDDLIVDTNDNILMMNEYNFKTTPTGYKIADSKKPQTLLTRKEIFAKDETGKIGTISVKTGKVECPFVFDTSNIYSDRYSTTRTTFVTTYKTDKDFILLNTNRDIIMQGKIEDLPKFVNKEFFTCYNKNSNTTKIFTYDENSDTLKEFGTYNNNVVDIFRRNNNCYMTAIDKNDNQVVFNQNNEILLQGKYDNISFEKIVFNNDYREYVDVILLEKDGLYGVYIPETNQLIEPKYKEIDLHCSGKTNDGKYKFFVKDFWRWGVINSDKQVELPFNYSHNQSYRQYATNPSGYNVLEIKDKNGNIQYFDIFEKDIIVTGELKQRLDNYKKEDAERTLKIKKDTARMLAADSDNSRTTKQPRFTEDERMIAMAGATLLAKTPIAGLIVNELMKD